MSSNIVDWNTPSDESSGPYAPLLINGKGLIQGYVADFKAAVGGNTYYASAASLTGGSAGASHAVNDTVTLSNGVTIKVLTVTSGAIATFAIANPGSYATVPVGAVAQSSTTGSGTGASFVLTSSPLTSNVYVFRSPFSIWFRGQMLRYVQGIPYVIPTGALLSALQAASAPMAIA
jgi:hypothetical protein